MRPFAVSIVGRDRPGIVGALAGVLLRHRVNIEDSRTSSTTSTASSSSTGCTR